MGLLIIEAVFYGSKGLKGCGGFYFEADKSSFKPNSLS